MSPATSRTILRASCGPPTTGIGNVRTRTQEGFLFVCVRFVLLKAHLKSSGRSCKDDGCVGLVVELDLRSGGLADGLDLLATRADQRSAQTGKDGNFACEAARPETHARSGRFACMAVSAPTDVTCAWRRVFQRRARAGQARMHGRGRLRQPSWCFLQDCRVRARPSSTGRQSRRRRWKRERRFETDRWPALPTR